MSRKSVGTHKRPRALPVHIHRRDAHEEEDGLADPDDEQGALDAGGEDDAVGEKLVPYESRFRAHSVRTMMCRALVPCVSMRYASRVLPETTVLKEIILWYPRGRREGVRCGTRGF